jgi:hypothetical protein
MNRLLDQLNCLPVDANVAADASTIVGLLKAVDGGGSAIEAIDARGATPRDWIAALAYKGAGGSGSLGPELTRSSPAKPRFRSAADEQTLQKLFPRAERQNLLCLQAGVYQILDFWDESHVAAQEADDMGESQFSSYWHAIAHRREPDPSNARYWFRRVGRHGVLKSVSESVMKVDWADADRREIEPLLGRDGLDPFGFVDFCSRAARSKALENPARIIQRIEMLVLLEATLALLE